MSILTGSKIIQNENNMALKLEGTYDEFVALNEDITNFITHVGGVINEEVGHASMVVILQMQIKIFTEIENIKVQQEWIIERLKQLRNDSEISKLN